MTPDPLARAFNRGADDRLACKPLSSNPYPVGSDVYRHYADGWKDIDRFYGLHAKVKKPLPPVKWQEKETA